MEMTPRQEFELKETHEALVHRLLNHPKPTTAQKDPKKFEEEWEKRVAASELKPRRKRAKAKA